MQDPDISASGRLSTEEIAGPQEIDQLLERMTGEIHSSLSDERPLALVGIRRRGDVLARRIQTRLTDLSGASLPCGVLDITLYRDDFDSLAEHPIVAETDIPFSVNEATIVLVDDVLFTGRTVRAAIDVLLDLGRPRRILLAVLVDRGWRELPIAADFAGRTLDTEADDDVQVLVREIDERDAVLHVRSLDGGDVD
jgi:pyrimidine operon attenuation protein / uracil phosphoribosyltransferase